MLSGGHPQWTLPGGNHLVAATGTDIRQVAQPPRQHWTRRGLHVNYCPGPCARWSTWEAARNACALPDATLRELPPNTPVGFSGNFTGGTSSVYGSSVLGQQSRALQSRVF